MDNIFNMSKRDIVVQVAKDAGYDVITDIGIKYYFQIQKDGIKIDVLCDDAVNLKGRISFSPDLNKEVYDFTDKNSLIEAIENAIKDGKN